MTEHYYSEAPLPTEDELRLLPVSVRGRDLRMWVSSHVFSTGRLDPGTRELLRALPELPAEGTFLDLGCGWGPVAVTAALESPAAKVWAVDVNPRALELTRRNARENGAENVHAALADEAWKQSTDVRFDRILSNPPVRIGKAAVQELVDRWLSRLAPTGEAWLVMGKNLGGDSLLKWLQGRGYEAVKHSSRKGYRIIRVVGPGSAT
ncbi:methyltransferase [Actinomyces sp. F1_1611]